MIEAESFGSKVPIAVQTEVLARQRDTAEGILHPFHAKQAVLDNEGHEVKAKRSRMTKFQNELAGARRARQVALSVERNGKPLTE